MKAQINFSIRLMLAFSALTLLGIRKRIWPVKKLSDEVFVWPRVQIVCIWSS